jgi:hypothetical protein
VHRRNRLFLIVGLSTQLAGQPLGSILLLVATVVPEIAGSFKVGEKWKKKLFPFK